MRAIGVKAGGRSDGGAEISPEGRRLMLIAAFRRLEQRLARFSSLIAENELHADDAFLLRSAGIWISARNAFQTEVVKVRKSSAQSHA